MTTDFRSRRCLLLYTKPARPGGVKTRLIGELSPRQAAEIHSAFLGDLSERLQGGRFHLQVSWALEGDEGFPADLVSGEAEHVRQHEGDLGDRLHGGLAAAARRYATVAAVGSDHPELGRVAVEHAFERLEADADAVFGPTADGGYYLVGLKRTSIESELFEGIPWSTGEVLAESLERCRRLGFEVALLPEGHDVDVAADLRRLAERLTADRGMCPRTRSLLESWGWLNGSRQ
ncbi:MAG: glycosyltransferase [bacterium]|nr:glycosyltransferase [bacterium]